MADEIKVKDNSRERVAFDLAYDIASKEEMYNDAKNYRKNLLDLYAECIEATSKQRLRR